MKKFKCITSFDDDENKHHRYGDIIEILEYDKLTSSQKRKYKLQDVSDITMGNLSDTVFTSRR